MLGVERGEDVRRSAWLEQQAVLQVKANRTGAAMLGVPPEAKCTRPVLTRMAPRKQLYRTTAHREGRNFVGRCR